MVKTQRNQDTKLRKHLREFVNNMINQDFAQANENLTSAVQATVKAKIDKILQENP
jgi:ribosomal protein S20